MAKIKSDIEIARASKIKPISDVLKKYNIPDNHSTFSPMGRHIAKSVSYTHLTLPTKA